MGVCEVAAQLLDGPGPCFASSNFGDLELVGNLSKGKRLAVPQFNDLLLTLGELLHGLGQRLILLLLASNTAGGSFLGYELLNRAVARRSVRLDRPLSSYIPPLGMAELSRDINQIAFHQSRNPASKLLFGLPSEPTEIMVDLQHGVLHHVRRSKFGAQVASQSFVGSKQQVLTKSLTDLA